MGVGVGGEGGQVGERKSWLFGGAMAANGSSAAVVDLDDRLTVARNPRETVAGSGASYRTGSTVGDLSPDSLLLVLGRQEDTQRGRERSAGALELKV